MALVDRMNHEVRQLKPSDILQFNAEISGIEGIVKLTLGEPDFPTQSMSRRRASNQSKMMRAIIPRAKACRDYELRQAIIWQRNIKPPMIRRRRF